MYNRTINKKKSFFFRQKFFGFSILDIYFCPFCKNQKTFSQKKLKKVIVTIMLCFSFLEKTVCDDNFFNFF